ncbi:BLUF domain-containing protein [Tropicibacter sp. R15_0]|uniref:BLUF domain-containing protein n=1 Tax=Tropicibacter sp. R15_0 TaxID=2821101 RepID=UPI001AD9C95A|nr:BLUF domain-containing protein [Tropicibacter sp. R15_0]MBO9465863.1 BLUF domain-containing protein [Tropicibacter sp. R15_0]
MLFQTMYISRSIHPQGHLSDLEIMEIASQTNQGIGITGVLLRDKQRFLQIVEGDKAQIETLLDKIQNDQRHYDVQVLFSRKLTQRNFEDWAMAYAEIEPGVFDQFTELKFSDQLVLEDGLSRIRQHLTAAQ